MKPTIIQFLGSLGMERGGLTKAVYQRCRLYSDLGFDVVIATTNYQVDVDKVFARIVESGSLPKGCTLRNLYADIGARGAKGLGPVEPLVDFSDAESKVREAGSIGHTDRYYSEGIFLGLDSVGADGKVRTSTYHSEVAPWLPLATDTFDGDGRVRKRTYLDSGFKPRYQILYGSSGGAYLSSWIDGAGRPYRVALFNSDGSAAIFPNIEAASHEWVRSLITTNTVVFSDEPLTMPYLIVAKKSAPDVKAFAVVHTTHYKNNTDPSGGLKSWVPKYIDNIEILDGVIFMTAAQRLDFLREIPVECAVKCVAIPHAAPARSVVGLPRAAREPGLFVVVARLSVEKRVKDAIAAFAQVAKDRPEVRLEVYGVGPELNNLKRQVQHLGVSEKVKFCGYTETPLAIFRRAWVSIATGSYEGFGLTLLESLSQGCPVISYDVKYGPAEIVKHGVNGRLVASGDVAGLASEIHRLAENSDEVERLSEGAFKVIDRYGEDVWREGWSRLIGN